MGDRGRVRAQHSVLKVSVGGFATALVFSVLLGACTTLRVRFPVRTLNADWPTDGRTPSRDHVAAGPSLELPLKQAWIYNAGAGFAAGSPLVVDGTVFVGTRRGEVHAVNLLNGEKVGSEEFGRSIEGTPALADQVLFVPNAWGKHALTAFQLNTGTRRWRYDGVPIEAPVLALGHLVIVGDVEGNAIGIDQNTGEVVWRYEFGDFATILSGPAAVDAGRVAFADETGRIALLRSATGEQVWLRSLGTPVEATLSTGSGLIFVPTTRGRFFALRAQDGTTAWEYSVDDDEVRFASAAVTKDYVIFGGTDGTMRAVSIENGSAAWTFHTDGTIAAAPVVNGDNVFVGAMDEKVYAVNREDGSIQWQASLRGRVKSAPAVRDGYLIVMSEPRYVYAFANAANIRD